MVGVDRLLGGDQDSCLDPLWEIYGHEPTLFHFMADWAASIDAHYFFNQDLFESQHSNGSSVKFQTILSVWSQSYHPKLVHTASFLSRLQRDWNSMRDCWLSYGGKDTAPFSAGQGLVCNQVLLYAVEKEVDAAVKQMAQLSRQSHTSLPQNESPDCAVSNDDASKDGIDEQKLTGGNMTSVKRNKFTCHYLLASAGSGKTQRLMDALSKCYGFYLTSGAIEDDPMIAAVGEALYQPRTTASSQDTKFLFETTQVPWLRMNGASMASSKLSERCYYLFRGRLELLYQVGKRSRNQSLGFTFSPQTWLQYQLSSQSKRDSFTRLLWLSIVANPGIIMLSTKNGDIGQDDFLGQGELLWCFDEAQCDLLELSRKLQDGSDGFITILEALLRGLRKVQSVFRHPDIGVAFYLSGTALNIDKMRAAALETRQSHFNPAVEVFAPKFPLVRENEDFINVFVARTTELLGILHESTSGDDFIRKSHSRNRVFIAANERTFSSSRLFEHFQGYYSRLDSDVPSPISFIIGRLHHGFGLTQWVWAGSGFWVGFGLGYRYINPIQIQPNTNFRYITQWLPSLIPNPVYTQTHIGLGLYIQNLTQPTPWCSVKFIGMIEKSKPQILKYSIPFRGRYRWSVYYAEELLERFFKDGTLANQAIEEVAKEAEHTLKAPLRRRLEDLAKNPEKMSLMKDVFNMAVDADLFGRSRILCSNDSSVLIEHALGYVDSFESEGAEAVKVCLVERLVVDSVMEHLEETGQLETLINDYLYANQFHEAALGDIAEFNLAASVYSSQTLPQRGDFVSAFDSVYRISTTGCAFNEKPNLANFFLDKGVGLRRDYISADGKDLDLKQWLQLVREEAPRPTFLFPEHVAGPDLMFVYKERAGMRRIVFAIQVSTPYSRTINHKSDF